MRTNIRNAHSIERLFTDTAIPSYTHEFLTLPATVRSNPTFYGYFQYYLA